MFEYDKYFRASLEVRRHLKLKEKLASVRGFRLKLARFDLLEGHAAYGTTPWLGTVGGCVGHWYINKNHSLEQRRGQEPVGFIDFLCHLHRAAAGIPWRMNKLEKTLRLHVVLTLLYCMAGHHLYGSGVSCHCIEINSGNTSMYGHNLVPSPSETWFRGISVGGSFRLE